MVDLHRKVRSAYAWSLGGNLLRQVFSVGLSMLLARFLTPGDYGLVGIVSVFIIFLSAVQDLGVGQAIIYFPDAEEHLATLFTASTASGLLLSGVIFASSPLVASFYHSPMLVPIMRWLSLTLFLGGLRSVPQALITKRLLFGKITAIEGICSLAAAGSAVYLAWHGFGVWSLVINILGFSTLSTVTMLVVVPPKFTLRPHLPFLRKVVRWSTPLTGSTLLFNFYDNADDLVVGKVMDAQHLGFYSLAFRLATLVNERIGAIVSRVSFPTFAAMRNDPEQRARHWLSVTRKSALISFPALAMIALLARDLIGVVLGPKWLPSVPVLQLLCVVGTIRVLTPVAMNLLPALGRPDLSFRYSLLNSILMPVSFVIGARVGGIVGVGWAWVLVFPFIAATLITQVLRLVGTPWRIYISNLTTPVISSAVVVATMAPALYLLPAGLLRLAISCLVAGLALAACYLCIEECRVMLPDRMAAFSRRVALAMPGR
jgi:teichuronic acid exporter